MTSLFASEFIERTYRITRGESLNYARKEKIISLLCFCLQLEEDLDRIHLNNPGYTFSTNERIDFIDKKSEIYRNSKPILRFCRYTILYYYRVLKRVGCELDFLAGAIIQLLGETYQILYGVNSLNIRYSDSMQKNSLRYLIEQDRWHMFNFTHLPNQEIIADSLDRLDLFLREYTGIGFVIYAL